MNVLVKSGNECNVVTYKHFCDTTEDMKNIDPRKINLGSSCVVINGSGGINTYLADSSKQWHLVNSSVNLVI